MDGLYYKEWSCVLNREMEFKVYGTAGVPVLALPARGGRFYDWENNAMPDAVSELLNRGEMQLFCADSIDSEALFALDVSPRRRAEMQEKYFIYLTTELYPRILSLNNADQNTAVWCVGVDTGAVQAVNCRLRRPELFTGAVGLSGTYNLMRYYGDVHDDLVLRNSPMLYLNDEDLFDSHGLKKADENQLLLCAGQGSYENDALEDTNALSVLLQEKNLPAHVEVWGTDVAHDWYWWGKMWSIFASCIAEMAASISSSSSK